MGILLLDRQLGPAFSLLLLDGIPLQRIQSLLLWILCRHLHLHLRVDVHHISVEAEVAGVARGHEGTVRLLNQLPILANDQFVVEALASSESTRFLDSEGSARV